MKIKKSSSKKAGSPPADVAAVVEKISKADNDDDIITILHDIPIWRYQRADLHAWIPAIDRFDDVLANIIQSYELTKLQTNDFTPKTKELLLGILGLTRMMMENCTSRKLYSSYDRLADLLLTTDLDVLHATILLLLRPGQQYGAGIQMEPSLLSTISNRLLTLTKGWEQFQEAGIDVVQLASQETMEPVSSRVTLQYYPQEGSSTSISALDLDVSQLQTPDQIADVAEENKIPVDDQLSLLHKARLVTMIRDRNTRRKLLSIRLLAVATFIYITPEESSQSSIFLYETSLVNQLASLMVPGRGVGDAVLSAAVYAIDACAHHRNKLLEVSAAIGTNVSHGVLISLLRDTLHRLTGGGEPDKAEHVMFEVVDSLLTMVAFVATSPPHSNQIIGAGIIPVILEFPKTRSDKRDNYIARMLGLVDALIFSSPQGLTSFSNADGITTLVNTVRSEMDILSNLVLPEPTYALSKETITSYTTTPLKSVLRTIHRLMQMTGGAEGLRNLVDSDLPKLLRGIFKDASTYGNRVFASAITVMATFVHNEPTSLGVLQELQLPHALYEELEREIPSTYEVLAAVPNAIGALCLNQAGIDFTLEHAKLLESYVRVAAANESHALQLGINLDELVRHHPALRKTILGGALDLIRATINESRSFVPSEEDRPRYLLDASDIVGESDKAVENDHVNKLASQLNLLQGLLRNSNMAKEFASLSGVTTILEIPELPCIPMQGGHAHSSVHLAVINTFQCLGEADPSGTARALLDSVKHAMGEIEEYREGNGDWRDLGDKLPVLRGLVPRIFYVASYFSALPLSQSRNPGSLLEEIKKNKRDTFLEELGRLHRSAMTAVAHFRADSPPREDGTNDDLKGPAGKYLSARLYTGIAKTFKTFVRLLYTKRAPEPAHRKAADLVSSSITRILIAHAEHALHFEGAVRTVYSTMVIANIAMQLFDERGHEGNLHMILFLTFERSHGINRLLDLVDYFLEAMEEPSTNAGMPIQINAGVTVSLDLLSALVRPKAVIINPQTTALQQRVEYNFSPTDILIRLRRDIFPRAQRVWAADWLLTAPLKVSQKGIKAFLSIMEAKDETPQTGLPLQPRPAAGIPQPIVRLPTVAEPALIDQLVDMGFPRGSAEQALIRARNNVAAAADMILSMPHVLEAAANAAAPPAAAAAEPAPAPETAEAPAAVPIAIDGEAAAAPDAGAGDTGAPALPAIDTANVGTPPIGHDVDENDDDEEDMDVDSPRTPSPIEPPEAVKKDLDGLRANAKDAVPARAMVLMSSSQNLMFDLIPAFPMHQAGLATVLKDFNVDDNETLIANKLRLFSLLAHDRNTPDLSEANATAAFEVIKRLPLEASPRPLWTTALLLFAETVMIMTTNTREVKIGDEATSSTGTSRREEQDRLTAICRGIFADTEATREELISAYRCMVVLTRDTGTIDFANCLAPFKHKLDARISTCHGTLAMILRHTFEDATTLREVMRRQMRYWFTHGKTTDVNTFVKQLRQYTARDSDAFVDAVEKECELIQPSPVNGVYHIRGKKEVEKAAASDPFQGGPASHPAMELLVRELGSAAKLTLSDKAVSEGYTGLIFSLITEVAGSYMAAKKSFMDALRETAPTGPKSRNGIAPIINDLVGCVDLARDLAQEAQIHKHMVINRPKTVSGWACTMLVALCSDITTPCEANGVPEDLATIRRTVLDAIVKVLKESATQEPSIRYGKLWAIGELVFRLLSAKAAIGTSKADDMTLQIAKAMVEKNFVGLLTDAMGNVDLNFPNVKVPLLSVLRALETLSKISIKWNKVDKTLQSGTGPTDAREGSVASSASDDELSDMGMDDIEEDAPDLYRNSALGILGGEMEDDSDGEDGDEDEDDDMMDIYGDEMDEDDEADTEPSTDEDMDEDEDMDGEEEEWTDEDDEENPDDIHPEIVIGAEEPDVEWDREGDAILDGGPDGEEAEVDDETFQAFMDGFPPGMGDPGMGDMDDMDDMDEMDDEEAILMGEDGEDLEMEMDEDPDDDEDDPNAILDALEEHGGIEATYHPERAPGHWGWSTDTRAGGSEQPRSRLMMDPHDPMSALGLARPSDGQPAPHPLLANPALVEDRHRQLASLMLPGHTAQDTNSLMGRMGPDAARLVDNVLRRQYAVGRSLRIGLSDTPDGGVHLDIGGRRYTFPPANQQGRGETAAEAEDDITGEFIPKPTAPRWHDEMHICGEDSAKLVNHIINRLLPEARKVAAKNAEELKKKEEEAAVAAAKAEEESREAEAQKEKEAEEARKAEAAAAAEVALPTSEIPTPPQQDVEMTEAETVDEAAPTPSDAEAVPAEPTPEAEPSPARILISIHGRDVDITGTGIDLEFLQALPDDMRAEIVDQHMREHNRGREAVADTSGSSHISPEFLNALPAEIRNEVMLQERMEQARRRPAAAAPPDAAEGAVPPAVGARIREQLRLAAAEVGGAGGAPFSLDDIATWGPSELAPMYEQLRDLIGGGNNPVAIGIAGAGGAREPTRPAVIFGGASGSRPIVITGGAADSSHKRSRRDAVQLLDKPGVASLVRLLFFPEAFKRDYLQRVLVNLCENSSTRADLLNLLLSVVQDGTGDLPAVDKSFSQMSLKPGATPKSTPKTPKAPETPGPQSSNSGLFAGLQSDHIPTFIAQRCFEALTHIVAANSQAVNFFLTEHEQPVGLRKPTSKKGKGKEKMIPQTKFPIVVLLGFLDRSVLLQAPGMMESFASLLSAITKPLVSIKANAEKAAKEKKASAVEEPESEAAASRHDAADTLVSIATQTPRPIPNTGTPAKPKAPEASTSTASSALTTAPAIPPSILKLVVNCLTVGECPSRTFGHTLSIMQNLSTIPEAKETILGELRDRAQQLGQVILEELRELNISVQDEKVELGTSLLAKFAPPSSSQAQLLRLLKTIDYLHCEKVDSDPPGEVLTEQEKAIGQTFDTFDFEPMWKELSACLSTVEARGSTDQIATVLLPLVEALMVICKYRRPETTRETRSPSVAPSSTGETDNIFVSFTTTHRKVLNAIVRTNPGLLSGSFSLLVRNPRVLEFDNKRNWFLQKLKRKRDQPAHAPVLSLNIRRQYVFEDSFRALERRTGNEVKYGKLSVKFHTEDGIDAGGVTREWYSVLAQQIFDPNFALFEPCAADAQTYQPNKASAIVDNHLSFFKFVGRIIGKAVFDGRLLDAYFSRAFYKQILGKTVDMRDLESIDPEFHKSLQWMLDNDITDVIDQEFTIEDDEFGEKKVVELKEGGASIPLTEENKEEYVRLVVSYRVENSIKDQIKAFLNGFYEIIPRNLIQIFEADQLELLISGITSVDVDELKNATQMGGWKSGDPEISWFWRALRSFSQEERARFLMFVTSSSRVPLGGFTQLQGASGIQPFQIQKLYSREGSLPQASTCFNLLLLPKYESYEQLRDKLMFAIYETGGFGKA